MLKPWSSSTGGSTSTPSKWTTPSPDWTILGSVQEVGVHVLFVFIRFLQTREWQFSDSSWVIKDYLTWDAKCSLEFSPGWGTSWPLPWHKPYDNRPLGWAPSPQWTHAAPWPGEHIWLRRPSWALLPNKAVRADHECTGPQYWTISEERSKQNSTNLVLVPHGTFAQNWNLGASVLLQSLDCVALGSQKLSNKVYLCDVG